MTAGKFQCSSASRKFLNRRIRRTDARIGRGFSALQRAENSSIADQELLRLRNRRFSALQRAENSSITIISSARNTAARFSALQRAENSSIEVDPEAHLLHLAFQCSSASRKFLNKAVAR